MLKGNLHQKPRVGILYIGGTIGMLPKDGRLVPHRESVDNEIKLIQARQEERLPEIAVIESEPPIDSADMTPQNWVKIANSIIKNYKFFDGFVILHGTDTLAYTSSALSFLLDPLKKPVVVTGSQQPLVAEYSDAQRNLLGSILIASSGLAKYQEVVVCFGDRVIRGNRATKYHTRQFDAFASPNFPLIAMLFSADSFPQKRVCHECSCEALENTPETMENTCIVVRIVPGGYEMLNVVLKGITSSIRGILLELFGSGTAPSGEFLETLKKIMESEDMMVFGLTQVRHGASNLSIYEAGNELLKLGVVGLGDMTCEAAVAKFNWLVSQNKSSSSIRKLMTQNLRGEISGVVSFS